VLEDAPRLGRFALELGKKPFSHRHTVTSHFNSKHFAQILQEPCCADAPGSKWAVTSIRLRLAPMVEVDNATPLRGDRGSVTQLDAARRPQNGAHEHEAEEHDLPLV
jgi:hypothetical protein